MDTNTDTEIPDWCNDAKLHEACEAIVEYLMRFGDLSEPDARALLEASELCAPERYTTVGKRAMFFHWIPCWWAIDVLHPETYGMWHLDPSIWPPGDGKFHEFCEEIVECLTKYGGLSESAARVMLDESKICGAEQYATLDDRAGFFDHLPYSWAMRLLHAETNPTWYKDPSLWPRPKDH